jgi:hypothetical protein
MESNVERHKATADYCPGTEGQHKSSFLGIEGKAFEIRREILAAVDQLIKLHFIMDIAYSVPAHHILHYIQKFAMNISDELPVCRSVLDLASHGSRPWHMTYFYTV